MSSAETCAVVLVRYPTLDTPVRVNKSDYDANPSAYVLWDGPEPAPAPAAKPSAPAAAVQYLVAKVGRVHMVVDLAGNEVQVPGIDAGGYAHEVDAWNAIAALGKQG